MVSTPYDGQVLFNQWQPRSKGIKKVARSYYFLLGHAANDLTSSHNALLLKGSKPPKRPQGAKCLTHWIQSAAVQVYLLYFITVVVFLRMKSHMAQAGLELIIYIDLNSAKDGLPHASHGLGLQYSKL